MSNNEKKSENKPEFGCVRYVCTNPGCFHHDPGKGPEVPSYEIVPGTIDYLKELAAEQPCKTCGFPAKKGNIYVP